MDTNIQTVLIDHKGINIYLCHADNVYENLTTDNEKRIGKIRPEDAHKVFKIPVRLNDMIMRNPLLIDMIRMFKTKYSDMIEPHDSPFAIYHGVELKGSEEDLEKSFQSP